MQEYVPRKLTSTTTTKSTRPHFFSQLAVEDKQPINFVGLIGVHVMTYHECLLTKCVVKQVLFRLSSSVCEMSTHYFILIFISICHPNKTGQHVICHVSHPHAIAPWVYLSVSGSNISHISQSQFTLNVRCCILSGP